MKRGTLICAGLALLMVLGLAADRPADAPAPALAEVLKARVDAATEGLRLAEQRYKAALSDGDEMNTWVQRLAEARLDTAQTKEQRIVILREAVQGMKDHEALVQKMFQAARVTQLDVVAARYARLGTEARLAREMVP